MSPIVLTDSKGERPKGFIKAQLKPNERLWNSSSIYLYILVVCSKALIISKGAHQFVLRECMSAFDLGRIGLSTIRLAWAISLDRAAKLTFKTPIKTAHRKWSWIIVGKLNRARACPMLCYFSFFTLGAATVPYACLVGLTCSRIGDELSPRSTPRAKCNTDSTTKSALPSFGRHTRSPTRGKTSNFTPPMKSVPSDFFRPMATSHTIGLGFIARLLRCKSNIIPAKTSVRNKRVPPPPMPSEGARSRNLSFTANIFSRNLPLGQQC
jgi:hypothetical protein